MHSWYFKRWFWEYEFNKAIERLQTKIVWRLPKWIVRWCVIRAASKAAVDNPNMDVAGIAYHDMYDAMR